MLPKQLLVVLVYTCHSPVALQAPGWEINIVTIAVLEDGCAVHSL
jgi:hypothetical protein